MGGWGDRWRRINKGETMKERKEERRTEGEMEKVRDEGGRWKTTLRRRQSLHGSPGLWNHFTTLRSNPVSQLVSLEK